MSKYSNAKSSQNQFVESEHPRFRGLAARANFLAVDSPDIVYSAKEICRFMAKPIELAAQVLKRLGRSFKDHPRMVFSLPF